MSKLGNALRERGIHNTYDLLRKFGEQGRDVAVDYSQSDRMRLGGAHVWSPTFRTNPDAHWLDYGKKRFSGRRAESLPAAKAWASEKYGIEEWSPCPCIHGAYVPSYIITRAKQFLKTG